MNNAGIMHSKVCTFNFPEINNTGAIICGDGSAITCEKFTGNGLIKVTDGTLTIHAEEFLFDGTIDCNSRVILYTKTKNLNFKHIGNGTIEVKEPQSKEIPSEKICRTEIVKPIEVGPSDNPGIQEIQATVLGVTTKDNQTVVILDRTIFFPNFWSRDAQSIISNDQGTFVVKDSEYNVSNGIVLHLGDFEKGTFEKNMQVTCSVKVLEESTGVPRQIKQEQTVTTEESSEPINISEISRNKGRTKIITPVKVGPPRYINEIEATVLGFAIKDDEAIVILDRTIFFPEAWTTNGVQSVIANNESTFIIKDTRYYYDDGIVVHFGKFEKGTFKKGMHVTCTVRKLEQRDHAKFWENVAIGAVCCGAIAAAAIYDIYIKPKMP